MHFYHTMPHMLHVLWGCAIVTLAAGTSPRAVLKNWICLSLTQAVSNAVSEKLAAHLPAPQPQTTCSHANRGPPHPSSSLAWSSESSHPDGWSSSRFAQLKNFCTNCQKQSQSSWSACSSTSLRSSPDRSLLPSPAQVGKCSPLMVSGTLWKCTRASKTVKICFISRLYKANWNLQHLFS